MIKMLMVVVDRGVTVDASHDLHSFCPIALVHGAELVAAAAHSVGPNGLQFHANI